MGNFLLFRKIGIRGMFFFPNMVQGYAGMNRKILHDCYFFGNLFCGMPVRLPNHDQAQVLIKDNF